MPSRRVVSALLLAAACSGGEIQGKSLSVSGEDEVAGVTVEDHRSVPEPNTNVCGVKIEVSSFEGTPPSDVSWDAVWVKASGEICCIAGACPEGGSPACACYAVTEGEGEETGAIAVGLAPGFEEGPQEGSEDGLRCPEISFILFEVPCAPPPEEAEEPVDPEQPVDPEEPVDPGQPLDPEEPAGPGTGAVVGAACGCAADLGCGGSCGCGASCSCGASCGCEAGCDLGAGAGTCTRPPRR